ncbi:MAG: sulfatase-like hydrolase/transferase, partial [Acidobacteriia bacterium]|nr:sulfatase-like hydrolase/transferase [Terriglobia bacterium]
MSKFQINQCLRIALVGAALFIRAASAAPGSRQTPNILFIVMDDVGIDQLKSFGYGGLTPAPTPVLDAVARHGIRFRNVWAMPECSPSRAMFYEGRYP